MTALEPRYGWRLILPRATAATQAGTGIDRPVWQEPHKAILAVGPSWTSVNLAPHTGQSGMVKRTGGTCSATFGRKLQAPVQRADYFFGAGLGFGRASMACASR